MAKGHDVIVYNRTRSKMGTLIAAGAKAAGSLAELVQRSEVVITMVADPAAVRDVVTAKTACDLFGKAWDKGFGDRDISAVIRALTDN